MANRLSYMTDPFLCAYSLLENSHFTRAQSNTTFNVFMLLKVWVVYFGYSFTICIEWYWYNNPPREGWCWKIQGRVEITNFTEYPKDYQTLHGEKKIRVALSELAIIWYFKIIMSLWKGEYQGDSKKMCSGWCGAELF